MLKTLGANVAAQCDVILYGQETIFTTTQALLAFPVQLCSTRSQASYRTHFRTLQIPQGLEQSGFNSRGIITRSFQCFDVCLVTSGLHKEVSDAAVCRIQLLGATPLLDGM